MTFIFKYTRLFSHPLLHTGHTNSPGTAPVSIMIGAALATPLRILIDFISKHYPWPRKRSPPPRQGACIGLRHPPYVIGGGASGGRVIYCESAPQIWLLFQI